MADWLVLLKERLAVLGLGGAGELTPARAALLSNLNATITSRAAPGDQMDLLAATITAIRQTVCAGGDPAGSIGKLLNDYLNATISSRAAAADYTAARAGYLDRINSLTRPQTNVQATTVALVVIGAAIVDAVPFRVSGLLSLALMQAGDTFLVIEEIRDFDDVAYVEYGRNSYIGVQVSPMIQFTEKKCQGWRVSIQRTAGVDRNITYQFFKEVKSA